VIRRLDGALQGDYSTLFYGVGLDLSDLREYQPQDDIRHIDWNVTARMNTLHVRQYLEDRELTTWFLLDLSRSMSFGRLERQKLAVLVDFVATLARLLTRGGNRVGAILYDTLTTRPIPARAGRNQVLRLIRDLHQEAAGPARTATDLSVLLNAALGAIKRRSLLFLVSDFISEPGWERPLSLLSRRHEVIAVRLWDPQESQLPDVGFIYVEDAETGEQLPVDTGDPVFRRDFLRLAERRESGLQEGLTRAGVEAYSVSTREDLVRAIVRMAALRKMRRR
jgi:uncharacterized protein (DUF58 family)